MSLLFSLSASALLLTAAWNDIATRLIPDEISLGLLAVGAVARLFEDGPSVLAFSAGSALLLFVLLFILHSRGLIGGGDVKIMTALAIGLSPLDCYRFIVATAIAGGVLGITYLVLSRWLPIVRSVRGASLLSRAGGLLGHAAPSRSCHFPPVNRLRSRGSRLCGD
jgi:prepilin peptidase CpaA